MTNDTQLWRLDSHHQTVLIGVDAYKSPYLIWFGEKLESKLAKDALLAALDPANAKATLDEAQMLSLFPQAASGYIGEPALRGHRNGEAFAPAFKVTDAHKEAQQLKLLLSDSLQALDVTLILTLDNDSSVLSIQTCLTNNGGAYQLDWLASATMAIPDAYNEALSLHGRWGREFQQQRQAIGFHRLQIENQTGRTSHEHFPGLIVGRNRFSFDTGSVLGMQLAWSGNHRTLVEKLSNGNSYMQTGAALLPGEVVLKTGESFTTPMAYFSAAEGLNQMSQQFHAYTRSQILPAWTRSARPVHANSWEALYFDHRVDQLIELIDAAADIGAERFVLDDGWFLGRRDDTSSLGDWFVDRDVYPEGLAPIVEHVRSKGMQFGLWFEPEMISPNSKLYKQHPDWALHVSGQHTPLARNQLVLNTSIPAVQAYLLQCIKALVDEYAIDYIKWDMNRNLVLPADGARAQAVWQPHALYALLAELNQHKPDLEIETCASGGARTDLAVFQHTGRVWTSDNIDPIDRLGIQQGFKLFFPPEIMGSHVGHDRAHLTGRETNLNTRALVALQGQYGFELDARELSDAERGLLAEYTNIYKSNREWIGQATQWQLDTRANLFASGFVSADQSKSLWTVIAESSLAESCPERLILRGLAPTSTYRVSANRNSINAIAEFGIHLPKWVSDGVVLPGELLMKTGLSMPVLPAQGGLLIECTK